MCIYTTCVTQISQGQHYSHSTGFHDLMKSYLMLLKIQDPGLPHLFPSPDRLVMVQTLTLLSVSKLMVMNQRDE